MGTRSFGLLVLVVALACASEAKAAALAVDAGVSSCITAVPLGIAPTTVGVAPRYETAVAPSGTVRELRALRAVEAPRTVLEQLLALAEPPVPLRTRVRDMALNRRTTRLLLPRWRPVVNPFAVSSTAGLAHVRPRLC